ncbi:18S rRNA uridine methyltransferase [Orobanche gracilis]
MDTLRPCSRQQQKQPKRILEDGRLRDCKTRKLHSNPSTPLEEEEKITEEKPFSSQNESIHVISSFQSSKKARVTFLLDNASLKKGVVRKSSQTVKILNSDQDANFLLKQKKDLNDYRPDILYRAVLAIFDSPVCKAGLVHGIYVKVNGGVLFEIKSHVRVPRTIKRFNGLMLDLLQKSSIEAKDTGEKLLRVIEQPVTRHLPPNSRVIGISHGSKEVVKITDFVPDFSNDVNIVFVVSVTPPGSIDKLYSDDVISSLAAKTVAEHELTEEETSFKALRTSCFLSSYPLSASRCVGEICDALEDKWEIV